MTSNGKHRRLFIAIDLDHEVRLALKELIGELRPAAQNARWVAPENMHMTVKFLGDTDPDMVPDIAAALGKASVSVPPFDFDLQGVGAFSSPEKARVVWIGVARGADRIGVMHRSIDAALAELGLPADERSFRPHLTIARLRMSTDLTGLIETVQQKGFGTVKVEEVILYESELMPQGPVYNALLKFPLGEE